MHEESKYDGRIVNKKTRAEYRDVLREKYEEVEAQTHDLLFDRQTHYRLTDCGLMHGFPERMLVGIWNKNTSNMAVFLPYTKNKTENLAEGIKALPSK